MTKKLEELFDLPEANQLDITKEENSVITDIIAEDREVVLPNTPTDTVPEMQSALEKVDKIDAALPSVRQLDTSDKEMDDIAQLAQDTFKDLMLIADLVVKYSAMLVACLIQHLVLRVQRSIKNYVWLIYNLKKQHWMHALLKKQKPQVKKKIQLTVKDKQ